MSRLEKYFVNRRQRGPRNDALIERALAKVDKSDIREVLEIGCGVGHTAHFLRGEFDFSLHGVDIDAEQIAKATQAYGGDPKLRFHVADATALWFSDASFDTVVAQNTLHHISRWESALEEVARVLRPGGLLVWQDFAVREWALPLASPLRACAGVYSLAEVRRRLAARGVHQRVHERANRGIFERHDLVMQKLSVHGNLPALV
jgi:ubiquinone/menaquinone biosynthesis C-methylase UbiE